MTVHCGKGNDQTVQVLLDTGSEQTLIPGDPHSTAVYLPEEGLMEVDDQWNSTSGLPHPWPSVSPNPSRGDFPSSRMDHWSRHNSSWQNPHIGSLTCGVRAIMMGKAKWKPLELSLQRKRVNQREYRNPGKTAEMITTIEGKKDSGVEFPAHSNSNHLQGLSKRQVDLAK